MEYIDTVEEDEPLTYRRSTLITASEYLVIAEMEDDFHHFRISLSHDGLVVGGIIGESIRFPWTTCGSEAEKKVGDLQGLNLESLYKQLSMKDRHVQCTHLLDLVQLAIGHAAKSQSTCLYQATVTLTLANGATKAELDRDGSNLLRWDIDSGRITRPAPYSGLKVDGLAAWAHQHQNAELIEAVLVLQRAIHVSYGKIFDWSFATKASEMGMPATCHTFQQANASRAERVAGSDRDFRAGFDQMLAMGNSD